MNKKQTSKLLGSFAAKILRDGNSSKIQKKLAWWVLSQVSKSKETSKEMEEIASDVLKSDKYADETKSLAASLLSQSDKDR